MKAKTLIHFVDGERVRVADEYETVLAIWAAMHRSKSGSAFPITRVTGHGQPKRVAMLSGTILRVEEL